MKTGEEIIEVNFSGRYVRNQKIVRLSFFDMPFICGIFYLYFYGLNIGFIISIVVNIILSLFFYYLWYSRYKSCHPFKIRLDNTGMYVWKLNETEEFIKWRSIQKTKEGKFLGEKLKFLTYRPDKTTARGFFSFPNNTVLPIKIGNTVESEYNRHK